MPVATRGRGGRPSLFDLEACRAWRQARDQAPGATGHVDVAKARAEKEIWQARNAEQAFLIKAKQLVARADLEKIWTAEVAAVRTLILDGYVSSTDRVFRAATLDGRAGVERELRAMAEAVLEELANSDRPVEVAS